VIWPFHWDPTVGYIAGGAVLGLGTLDNVVKLIKRIVKGPQRRQVEA